MRACFMGNWVEGLEALLAAGADVRFALEFESRSPSTDLQKLCARHDIRRIPVQTLEDVKAGFKQHASTIDLAVVCSFGILLDSELVGMLGTIVNVHPGDVAVMRGRHPLPWTIFERLPYMAITFHLIDGPAVDAGPVLAKVFVPVEYEGSYVDNERRLREQISPTLTKLLSTHLSGRPFVTLSRPPLGGSYRPPLAEAKLQQLFSVSRLMELFL